MRVSDCRRKQSTGVPLQRSAPDKWNARATRPCLSSARRAPESVAQGKRIGKRAGANCLPQLHSGNQEINKMNLHLKSSRLTFVLTAVLLAACGGTEDTVIAEDAAAVATHQSGGNGGGEKGKGGGGGGGSIPGATLVASAGVRSVDLTWSDNGAEQYNVYLSSSPDCDITNYSLCPDGRMLANVRPPHKADSLVNGRVYYAQVEGIHRRGTSLSNLAGARPTTLEFNASVWALATASDGTTYLGGDFTKIGLTSGQGVALDAVTAQPSVPGYPVIGAGGVTAAAPDGSGGWYIGGDFERVNSTTKKYLAHIRADGSLDPNWNPLPSSSVNAIAVMNGVVYIGGTFTTVNGQQRVSLAAIDAASGNLTAWNPNPNLGVWTIAAANGNIYVGGTFTAIGVFRRNYLAAIDTFGNVLPWDPNADGTVAALKVSGSTVYAGGFFNSVGGLPRAKLAAINASTGTVTAWNPSSQPCSACEVVAIATSGSTVYVGGRFTQIGNVARKSLAAIDAASGNVLAWNPAFEGFRVESSPSSTTQRKARRSTSAATSTRSAGSRARIWPRSTRRALPWPGTRR
jgi:hypothetical protein